MESAEGIEECDTPAVCTDSIESIAFQKNAIVVFQKTRAAGRNAVLLEHAVRQIFGCEQVRPALTRRCRPLRGKFHDHMRAPLVVRNASGELRILTVYRGTRATAAAMEADMVRL